MKVRDISMDDKTDMMAVNRRNTPPLFPPQLKSIQSRGSNSDVNLLDNNTNATTQDHFKR